MSYENNNNFSIPEKCSYCGNCLYVCPIYKITLYDTIAPRGKMTLIKEYNKSNLYPNKYLEDIFSKCILCQKCTEFCPSGISISNHILKMRNELTNTNFYYKNKKKSFTVTHHSFFIFKFIKRKIILLIWFLLIRSRFFYDFSLKISFVLQNFLPFKKGMITWVPFPFQGWTHKRFLPPIARYRFKQLWKEKINFK